MNENTTIKVLVSHLPDDLYHDGECYWHCWVDLTHFDLADKITVGDLMKTHDMTLDYYETYLPVLELDGLIQLKHKEE